MNNDLNKFLLRIKLFFLKYSCELFISLSMYIAKVLINYTC